MPTQVTRDLSISICVCLIEQNRIRTCVTSSLHEIYVCTAREWESHSCVDLFARNSLSCQKQRVGTCFQHVGMRLWADEGGRISDHSPTSLGVRKYTFFGSKHIEYKMYAFLDTQTHTQVKQEVKDI